MTQPNFDNMTRHELLAYVRSRFGLPQASHREDTEAFHKYMDSLQTVPGRIAVTTDEDLEAEMRKRINQQTH